MYYFSSNKSLADSLDECVDPQDPNFNKVSNFKRVTIFLLFLLFMLACNSCVQGLVYTLGVSKRVQLLELIYCKRLLNL